MPRAQLPDGRVVDTVKLTVVDLETKTILFKLSDGSELELRATITKIQRVLNEYADTGEPIYLPEIPLHIGIINIPNTLYGKPKQTDKNANPSREIA